MAASKSDPSPITRPLMRRTPAVTTASRNRVRPTSSRPASPPPRRTMSPVSRPSGPSVPCSSTAVRGGAFRSSSAALVVNSFVTEPIVRRVPGRTAASVRPLVSVTTNPLREPSERARRSTFAAFSRDRPAAGRGGRRDEHDEDEQERETAEHVHHPSRCARSRVRLAGVGLVTNLTLQGGAGSSIGGERPTMESCPPSSAGTRSSVPCSSALDCWRSSSRSPR